MKLFCVILCLFFTGCLFQTSKQAKFDSVTGEQIYYSKVRSIVVGTGDITTAVDASVDSNGIQNLGVAFTSEETGFSERAPEAIGSIGTATGNIIGAATGAGAAVKAGSIVIEKVVDKEPNE